MKKTELRSFNKSSPYPVKIECFHGTIEAYSQKSPLRNDRSEDGHFILSQGEDTFLAVADGVGGSPHGQEASSMVLKIIHQELQLIKQQDNRSQVTKKIERAFLKSNNQLKKELPLSATTLIVAWIRKNSVQFFYCGDSEGFVIDKKGSIKYRTIPHTPAGIEIGQKKISWSEMAKHPDRNIITNFLGNDEMEVDAPPSFILNPHDTVVVCSDGLTDNFGPQDLPRLSSKISLKDTISLVREFMFSGDEGKPDDCTILRFNLKKVA